MASGQKIAKVVQVRSQTPFFSYLRDKLLRVYRSDKTKPRTPNPHTVSGYYPENRFPYTQSARTQPAANLPGGVHHQLAANDYLDRDGRREVAPPPTLFTTDAETPRFLTASGEAIEVEAVSKGSGSNFGLSTPTPGFGHEWKRFTDDELPHAVHNKDFKALERYDRYTR